MKHLNYLPILGIIISLTSCSEESNLSTEEFDEIPIEVSAKAPQFTRTEGMEAISLWGFTLWSYYSEKKDGETKMLFADNYQADADGTCSSVETHNWPDRTSQFDFYAAAPLIQIEQMRSENDSLYIDFTEEQVIGNYDLMLASHPGISRSTHNGSMPLDFKHLLSKVTAEIAFIDNLEYSFPYYYASIEFYGATRSTYNITSGKWLVKKELPEDFDINNYISTGPIANIGGTNNKLVASSSADELEYCFAGDGYVVPQPYQVRCLLLGSLDSETSSTITMGNFELDLSGKAGVNYILKISTQANGTGMPVLKIETTEEEITAID